MSVNQLKAGVILSYISQGLQILITVFYTPVMLHLMGQSEYGIYQLAFSTVSLLSLMTFGFSSSYVKFFAKASLQEEKDKYIADLNGTFVTVFTVLACVVLLIGLWLAYDTEHLLGGKLTMDELKTAKVVMYILVVNCALHFIYVVPSNYIIANERFVVSQILGLIRIVMNPCITFPLIYIGYGSISLSIGLLTITIINLLLAIYYSLRKLRMHFAFDNLQWSLFKDIGIFSFWIFLESLITMLNHNVDRILLGKYVGTVGLTIYTVGYSIVTLYTTMSLSISSVFSPRINQMVEQGNCRQQLSNLFIRVGRIQFLVLFLFLLGFGIFGQRFFFIWVGPGYNMSYLITMILITVGTIDLIQSLAYIIQRAMDMQKYRDYLWLGVAIGKVALSIFLIQIWGILGAAVASAIATLIGQGVLMNWFYATKIHLDIKTFWKEISRMSLGGVIPLVVGILVHRQLADCSLLLYFTYIAAFAVVYCLSMYVFGFNSTDRLEVRKYVLSLPIVRRKH